MPHAPHTALRCARRGRKPTSKDVFGTRVTMQELVGEMSIKELRRTIEEGGLSHEGCTDKQELRTLLVAPTIGSPSCPSARLKTHFRFPT